MLIFSAKAVIQDNTQTSTVKQPSVLKTAWISAILCCANKICSSKQAFQQQIDQVRTLMSWNAYPKCVHNFIINRLKSNVNRNGNNNNNKDGRNDKSSIFRKGR